MVRLVKACLVTACLGLAVKFRQGPFGSVELRRVGSRRFCCGKVRLVLLG